MNETRDKRTHRRRDLMVRLGSVAVIAAALAGLGFCDRPPTPAPKAAFAPGGMRWDDLLATPKPTGGETFRYGPDPYQVADLWRPVGAGPHPVVLMVHGGCWTTEVADRTLMNYLAADLRGRGYAVWNIDYRGVDRPGGGYPGTFTDAGAAADLLARVAPARNLDLRRMVAVGHSAGGHLALWLAARPRLPRSSPLRTPDPIAIPSVISLGGLPDLQSAAMPQGSGCGSEVVTALVGAPTPARADVYADTSVPRLAPVGVPQTLVNGADDKIIPLATAHDYAATMRAAGDRVSVEIVPKTGHVELVAPTSPAWARTVALIEQAVGRP